MTVLTLRSCMYAFTTTNAQRTHRSQCRQKRTIYVNSYLTMLLLTDGHQSTRRNLRKLV